MSIRKSDNQISVQNNKFLQTIINSWPHFEEDEMIAVQNVLQSGKVNYWTGEEGKNFENEFAQFCDCKYGIALANGTVALELALYALDIGAGDEVIVPSRTFIASASAVVMRGAIPVMADVDFESQNINTNTIEKVLTSKTKAVIAVHLAGWPCDMDPILELTKERGIKVIEDCAQAHGARYKEKPVGSIGDVGAFSFCQDKIMTTGGEGGMIVTNNDAIYEKAWAFKDHGKSYDAVFNREHPPGFRWLHESFGTNWRMTEMQSAIGRVTLKKLDGWVSRRRYLAVQLTECFSKFEFLRVVMPSQGYYHSYYKYYVFINNEKLAESWDRDRIQNTLVDQGVPCFSGSCSEIYLEKAFENSDYGPENRLPVAKKLGETSLMFLVHPTITESEINRICQVTKNVFQGVQT